MPQPPDLSLPSYVDLIFGEMRLHLLCLRNLHRRLPVVKIRLVLDEVLDDRR